MHAHLWAFVSLNRDQFTFPSTSLIWAYHASSQGMSACFSLINLNDMKNRIRTQNLDVDIL